MGPPSAESSRVEVHCNRTGTAMLPVLLVSLLAAPAPSFEVEAWIDGSAELEHVESFDWEEPPALGEWSRRRRGELTDDDRVRDSVEAALAERGIERVVGDEAEVLVRFSLMPGDGGLPISSPRFHLGNWVQGISFGRGSRSRARFAIELLDPRTELPVWKGWADATFSIEKYVDGFSDPAEGKQSVLDAAARAIAEHLPGVDERDPGAPR